MSSLYYYRNYGVQVALKWYNVVWWKLMPGTRIKVKWPAGSVASVTDFTHVYFANGSDPNDHYRPWLESNVGKQGWDWDWVLSDDDISKNLLTIKFRRGKEKWATMASLRWS